MRVVEETVKKRPAKGYCTHNDINEESKRKKKKKRAYKAIGREDQPIRIDSQSIMEFHAVVLCGPGRALTPFSQLRSTGVCKALLPVANRPMFEYVLDWCEKAFFPKITLVTDEESYEEMNSALENYKLAKTNKKKIESEAEIVGSTEEVFQYATSIDIVSNIASSSGEILSYLKNSNKLQGFENFVILPCDFITNLPPQVLIEAYRNKSDQDIGLVVHYKNSLDIEDKKNTIFPKNYTVYTELEDGQQQLLDIYSKEDTDFHKALKLRTQMSWRYPNSTVGTKLLNSSIYFGSCKQIFEIFERNQLKFNEQYFRTRTISKIFRDLARRSWRHSSLKESISFLIVPQQATFFRSNNLPVLMEANRYFMKLQAQAKGQQAAKEKPIANVGNDSLIGAETELGEKTNVKRTVVGPNCWIGKRVKLTGCLILNDVRIEDDVQLENCIIGHHVIIQPKAKLINCNVESTYQVSKGTQAKGDTLLCFTLEGLVDQNADASDLSLEAVSSTEGDESDLDDDFDDEYVDNADGLFAY